MAWKNGYPHVFQPENWFHQISLLIIMVSTMHAFYTSNWIYNEQTEPVSLFA